jgi:hypothetical protein
MNGFEKPSKNENVAKKKRLGYDNDKIRTCEAEAIR